MSTLLLRLAAPMQSWGDGSKFTRRETRREPTKSGVIGLVAAALGRSREDSVDDLTSLQFGVRIDRPGVLVRDFHMAHTEDFWRDHTKGQGFVSERYYLSDAVFLVGLEGEDELLRTIERAILNPHYPLFLGRRSCPPEGKLLLGMRESGLFEALTNEPWQAERQGGKRPERVEIIVDDENGAVTRDLPLSFSQRSRSYGYRKARRAQVSLPAGHDAFAELDGHDPFAQLGGV